MTDLSHHGVKGMHWGVHKETDAGNLRVQGSTPNVDSVLHPTTKAAGTETASLIGARYGFHTTDIKAISLGDREYGQGTIAYVDANGNSKKREGVIHVMEGDLRPKLKTLENMGWLGKDCGNAKALLTHESAHAIFHVKNQKNASMRARNKALTASMKAAKKDGIPGHQFSSSVSGYASLSGMREELEAELFSQYHWSSNPPNFVKVWGETLHRGLGIDGTPFREGA